MPQPVIVTAWIRDADIEPFHRLRERFFPRNRNFLSAHVTLFHQLPGGEQRERTFEAVERAVQGFGESLPRMNASDEQSESSNGQMDLPVLIQGLFFMGRGVGYKLEASQLQRLRAKVAGAFRGQLGTQDAAPWRNPHITVMNKATPERAQRLLRHLRRRFKPCLIHVRGLQVWRYEQGPWTLLASYDFDGNVHREPGPGQPSTHESRADGDGRPKN